MTSRVLRQRSRSFTSLSDHGHSSDGEQYLEDNDHISLHRAFDYKVLSVDEDDEDIILPSMRSNYQRVVGSESCLRIVVVVSLAAITYLSSLAWMLQNQSPYIVLPSSYSKPKLAEGVKIAATMYGVIGAISSFLLWREHREKKRMAEISKKDYR